MAAFLQNNGDIILDAVLTDYGRKLLAKGDGSFNIVKFAFGDDEIDYGLFNPSAPSVSQDLLIANTPILEAFTNNAASMKSQLITMTLENVLYLPILKLANNRSTSKTGKFGPSPNNIKFEGYVVPVEYGETTDINSTTNKLKESSGASAALLSGVQATSDNNLYISVDQGLDSEDLDANKSLQTEYPMLYEEEYSVFVDNRFCSLVDMNNPTNTLSPLSVDDDGIAVYKFMQEASPSESSAVKPIPINEDTSSPIAGTKGSTLKFKLLPNSNLKNQNYYFDKYGKKLELKSGTEFLTLRMAVRVVGNTTGYSLEIPVLFAKYST